MNPASLEAQAPPDLEALKERARGVFEIEGVVFTDADERIDRLVVGVENAGLARSVEARLRGLGVSPQSVDVVVTAPVVRVDTLRDRVRPVAGGLQIRFGNYVCTMGFTATLGGVSGFVTNSHCTDSQGGTEGTLYYQPLNQTADEFIGTEAADPAYTKSLPGCPRNKVCRYSDSAFVQLASGVSSDLGYIKKTTGANNGSLEIAGNFTVTGTTGVAVGNTANKVGRTTGWTQGQVSRTCTDTSVFGSNILLLCQSFVNNPAATMVAGGDSGSGVFRITSGDSVELAGILWGSSGSNTFVFSPISGIEQELGALSVAATGAPGQPEDGGGDGVDDPAQPAGSVDVAVGYAMNGGPQGNRHLSVTISVADENGGAVGGATVSMTLSNTDTGGSWSATGTTGSNGSVSFTLNNAPGGCYTTTVNSVSGSGLEWDGVFTDSGTCK